MCEHLGRCSVPGAYNTSAGSAEPLTSRPNERIKGGQGELDLNLSRRNGKRQSGRNQATGRKLQVGQLDSRTGLGCLTLIATIIEESSTLFHENFLLVVSQVHETNFMKLASFMSFMKLISQELGIS